MGRQRQPWTKVFFLDNMELYFLPKMRFIRLWFLNKASKSCETPWVEKLLKERSKDTILKVFLRISDNIGHDSSPRLLFEMST